MMTTIYLHPEDDIAKVSARLQDIVEDEILLVFPKKSYLFSDGINLRLLKKQVDILNKRVFIFTMDETGQTYAKDAGFELKFLTPQKSSAGSMDVKKSVRAAASTKVSAPDESQSLPNPPKPKRRLVKSEEIAPVQPTVPVPSEPKKVITRVKPASTEGRTVIKTTRKAPTVPTTPVVSTVQGSNDFAALNETMPEKRAADMMFGDTLNHYDKPVAEPKRYGRFITAFVIVALLVIAGLILFVLPKADVLVYAKSKPVIRDVEVGIAASLTAPDSDKLTMPAMDLDQTVKGSKTFNSTGKKEVGSKAEGKIAIYNLTGKPLNLRAATTTLTIGGKNYFFTEDQNGIKTTSQGETSDFIVSVVAEQGGEDYNVPAGTRMEITNKVFGGKPQVLYAKTETALVGGNSRFISFVSDQDIATAKQQLEQELIDQLRDNLKQKQLALVDQAFTTEEVQFSVDKSAGDESPTLEATGVLRVKGLVFNDSQLRDLIRTRLQAVVSNDELLQEISKDTVSYRIKTVDLGTKVLSLIVHYESTAIGQVKLDTLRSEILGKSKEEASSMLLSHPEIDRVDITLSPGWQSSIPRFARNVHLEESK